MKAFHLEKEATTLHLSWSHLGMISLIINHDSSEITVNVISVSHKLQFTQIGVKLLIDFCQPFYLDFGPMENIKEPRKCQSSRSDIKKWAMLVHLWSLFCALLVASRSRAHASSHLRSVHSEKAEGQHLRTTKVLPKPYLSTSKATYQRLLVALVSSCL